MAKKCDTLFNKYRPQHFSDVIEQDVPKRILSEELRTQNFTNVLLFTGGAGTGKTTSARIYAHEVEPVTSSLIEMNCADATKVDSVRSDILEACRTRPLVGKYKTFILDECHQLSSNAQSALLKLLEEPPSYCIFILCTTDPQKLMDTILSRSLRFDFHLISVNGIKSRLLYILESERNLGSDGCGVQSWQDEAIDFIAQTAEGHMRDAIVLLEKVIKYSKNITIQDVIDVLGVTDYSVLFDLLSFVINKKELSIIETLEKIHSSGLDLKLFVKNFLKFVLEINKYLLSKTENVVISTSIPSTYSYRLQEFSLKDRNSIKSLLKNLLELNSSLRWETSSLPVIETNLLLETL